MGPFVKALRRWLGLDPVIVTRASHKAQRKAAAASRELHRDMARGLGRKSFLGEAL